MSANDLKRKRAPAQKFYAVHTGFRPGIYDTYDECFQQVKGFKGAKFKSFSTQSEAETFVKQGLMPRVSSKARPKFYGVQSGRVPGVYTSWDDASAQVTGWTKPKYRAFSTKAEAEAYVRQTGEVTTPDSVAGKKRKRAKDPGPDEIYEYGPGEGPLPEGAVDGFDPSVHLSPATGKVEYKSDGQFNASKLQAKDMRDDGTVKIWTDGSSRGNGTAGAIAGVGVYFGPGDKRNLAEPLAGARQTNQRAELTAILRALELSPRDRPVTILSDSQYAINCVTTWFSNWRANGWVSTSKKPVENKDLIEKCLNLLEERDKISNLYAPSEGENGGGEGPKRERARVKFVWVKGHAAERGNIMADALAVAGAKKGLEGGE